MTKKPAMQDIADNLGISRSAVSKALNDKTDISKELKHKVREAAEKCGYISREEARGLMITTTSIRRLLLCIDPCSINTTKKKHYEYIQALYTESEKKGIVIEVRSADKALNDLKCDKSSFVQEYVGLIFLVDEKRCEYEQGLTLRTHQFPWVSLGSELYADSTQFIATDYTNGLEKILVKLKLKNIRAGYLTTYDDNPDLKQLTEVFRNHCSDDSLYQEKWILESPPTFPVLINTINSFINQPEAPEYWICATEETALGASLQEKEDRLLQHFYALCEAPITSRMTKLGSKVEENFAKQAKKAISTICNHQKLDHPILVPPKVIFLP